MITLYNYQQEALHKIQQAFKVQDRALAVMASGLGKTIVAAAWAKEQIRKGRGLFLCHDNGILEQAMIEFKKVINRDATLGVFHGQRKDLEDVNILFASFQSFINWKVGFFEDEFDFIVVDESHHGYAPTYKQVIDYFTPRKLLGITATPDRMDEKDIREIFSPEVVDIPLEVGIARNWLTKVEYHVITDNLNQFALRRMVRDVLEEGKRVSIKQLNETIFIEARDEKVAEIILEHSGGDKQTIIFCEDILHAENFQPYIPGSKVYHSKRSYRENQKTLRDFREGRLQTILAVDKFNEGIDIPDTQMVVFLRCTDSETIFLQQLGRGLRKKPGKEKVIVLDFVANCDRIIAIQKMVNNIMKLSRDDIEFSKELLHVKGDAYDFIFTDEQLDIIELIRLIKRSKEPFYPTWQEASKVVIAAGIRTATEYFKRYKEIDVRLPSEPQRFYEDFPDWDVFLGRKKKEFYKTWQEASEVAIRAGIKTSKDYPNRYKEIDDKLPSVPALFYDNFPGWDVFLDKKKYATWQEASKMAINGGIKSYRDYKEGYKKVDLRLPSDPQAFYSNFPGWEIFLDKKRYTTWQEASQVVINAKVKSAKDYWKRYKEIDSKLPSSPNVVYSDFPGWTVFLGGEKKECYKTWREASKAAIKAGIKSRRDYLERYKKVDPQLPGNVYHFYIDFPGWAVFLGKS